MITAFVMDKMILLGESKIQVFVISPKWNEIQLQKQLLEQKLLKEKIKESKKSKRKKALRKRIILKKMLRK